MTKNLDIIPAIIADNQEELDNRLAKVIDIVDIVQLDFMDNKFVPNTSLWFDYTLPQTDVIFEAHLMVKHPIKWIKEHIYQIDMFLVHIECDDDIDSVIDLVRNAKRSIGLVINPDTPIEKLEPYLHRVDQVLVMTVNPGFYGSPFLPDTLEKIRWLKSHYPTIDLEVDGGITADTISLAVKAGADKFVSGSFIVKSDNPEDAIKKLREVMNL